MQRIIKAAKRRVTRVFNNNTRPVNFIVCGVQKGGTSALNAYLRGHPEICMADRKEVHFFDDENIFRPGRRVDYSAYHAFFSPGPAHRVIGEATPIYMYWHDAPRRMWEYNPDLKLIAVLRNPLERAFSHWQMETARKAETLSFRDAIRNERQRCKEALPCQHRVYSYTDRGFYLEQLRRLYRFFPGENVLVLKNEDLKNQPRRTLDAVCGFLGVSRFETIEAMEVRAQAYASEMAPGEKDYLRSVYEYEIRGIERELGWDCSHWLSG